MCGEAATLGGVQSTRPGGVLDYFPIDTKPDGQAGTERQPERYKGEARGKEFHRADQPNHWQCVHDKYGERDDETEFGQSHFGSSLRLF
jgi:hypothetical protein